MAKRKGIKIIVAFVIFLLIYTVAMLLVFLIPDEWVRDNVEASMQNAPVSDTEVILLPYGGKLSAVDTDFVMLRMNLTDSGGGIFERAMSFDGYGRYWHGYLVFLRPMLIFFQHGDILLMTTFLFYGLLGLVFYKGFRRLGLAFGAGLLFAFLFCSGFVVPLSLFYSLPFLLGFGSAALVLFFYTPQKQDATAFLVMLCVALGSMLAFVDMISSPLVSIGPAVFTAIAVNVREQKASPAVSVKNTIFLFLAWGLSYGLTWAAKWGIGYLLLGRNLFNEALGDIIALRLGIGSAAADTSIVGALRTNIGPLLTPAGIVCLAAVLLMWCVALRKRGMVPKTEITRLLPLGLVVLVPYIWYVVLSNHSQLHSLFTFRNQFISAWGFFYFAFSVPGKSTSKGLLSPPPKTL